MADSNVNIRINATNTASPAINQVKRDLGGLDKAAGTATGGISALAKVAGAAGLVAFGVQAAGATVELAKLGSASIAMKASFEQMAGGAENAASILDALTTASRGTISQYDLMLTANRSMLLGVADSAEEFSQLMQIATVRGRAMGLSTTQAFNDIVTGLGRESKLILDNLGILIDLEKAHEDYATSIGKTAAQLTDAERKQALINQVIANSADLLKDANSNANALAGEGFAQLNTAWTDFRTAIGESIGPILEARYRELARFLQSGVDELERQRAAVGITEGTNATGLTNSRDISAVLTVDLDNAKAQLAQLQAAMIDMATNAEAHIRSIYASTPGLSMAEAGQIFQETLNGITTAIGETEAKIADLEAKLGDLVATAPAFQVFIPAFGTITSAAGDATTAVAVLGETLRAVQRQAGATLSQFAPGRGTIGAGGALAGVAPSLGRAPTVDRSFGGLGGALNRRQSGIGVEPFGIVGGVGASFGAGGGGGGSIDNEAQKLANRLTSILNGALKSGINLDEILGRQDAIEEPARRLADIAVRGFESPWVDYIRNTFPEIWGEIESAGDPKAAAASILRDFEDGLRPELLDKGRAKELVKRALLGEQNTAALAAEIAGELASELGVSLEQAQQAAAGVLGTGTGDGTDTGMNGGVVAAAFTDDFVGTMGTMLARFEGVGGQAGASFQVGFLATTAQMPAAILANLASLLLPMLTAALAGQGTRTGAS